MLIKLCLTFYSLGKILKNLVMKGGTKKEMKYVAIRRIRID